MHAFKKSNKSVFIGPYVEVDPATTKVGKNCALNFYTRISNSDVGDYTYFSANCHVMYASIGSFCSIGPGTMIGLGSHPIDFVATSPIFYSTSKVVNNINWVDRDYYEEFAQVKMGDNVWLGANVYVVTRDVPPYAIVGGVPAKVIKYRFDEQTIEQLLQLGLFKKSEEWLKKHLCGAITPADLLESKIAMEA